MDREASLPRLATSAFSATATAALYITAHEAEPPGGVGVVSSFLAARLTACAECGALVPSIRSPLTLARTSSTAPSTIAESARLNHGAKKSSLIQSTAYPRSGPGERNSRSARLPAAPPRSRPSAIVQSQLRNLRDTRKITTTTPASTSANTAVKEVPILNAAPGFRTRLRLTRPANRTTGWWPDSWATTRALET